MKEVNILSLGAGVQSSTIALMAENNQLVIKGVNYKPDFAVFADTQAEPLEVYEWLEYLKTQIKSFPIYVVTKGNLERDNFILKYNDSQLSLNIPLFTKSFKDKKQGMLQRRCTRDYKIRPITNFIKKKVNVRSFRRYERVIINPEIGYKEGNIKYNVTYPDIIVRQFIGISTDEISRVKDSSEKWLTHFYPLIEMGMSRTDCLRWMRDNNYPTPPRSACYFCPYHSDEEWLRMKEKAPEDFKRAVDFEKKVQEVSLKVNNLKGTPFLHKSCKPIAEVEFKEGDNDKHFGNDCSGMCGN